MSSVSPPWTVVGLRVAPVVMGHEYPVRLRCFLPVWVELNSSGRLQGVWRIEPFPSRLSVLKMPLKYLTELFSFSLLAQVISSFKQSKAVSQIS